MAELNTSVSEQSEISGSTYTKEKQQNVDLEAQKIVTELRLDFLKVLRNLEGKEASFSLYGKSTSSSGIYRGSDRDILHFAVSNFKSPTGVLKSAVIRTTDIDCMTVSLSLSEAPSEAKWDTKLQ